jgi:CheY-like chemotaxis protein
VGGYLIKPITGTALQECIANALGLEAPVVVPASTPKAEPSRPRLRILAADDSRDGRALIQWCLDSGVYQVDFAENGRVAVDMFRMAKYDLVIMDIQMPDMDGYAATKAIRAWEKNSSAKPTPIIALTAYSAVEDAQKSLRAGCMAYLTKPITKERLREAIQLHAQRFAR